jgi:SAM-dependent methyltransferase
MRRSHKDVQESLLIPTEFSSNYLYVSNLGGAEKKDIQTAAAFTEKWNVMLEEPSDQDEVWKNSQKDWYMELYGYSTESDLKADLSQCKMVLDAGSGLGYKANWFAKLAPKSTIVGMDFSDSIELAAQRYKHTENLVFMHCDIAKTPFKDQIFDLISCDQVLHHTISPLDTLKEFHRVAGRDAVLNTYVYRKKALPRELLDDHFRDYAASLTHEQIWQLSEQLTQLGKVLSDLRIEIEIPTIPILGIEGGKQDIQRFLYWNFLKCFWNEQHGWDASTAINFDWYSPTIAYRYSEEEFLKMIG